MLSIYYFFFLAESTILSNCKENAKYIDKECKGQFEGIICTPLELSNIAEYIKLFFKTVISSYYIAEFVS